MGAEAGRASSCAYLPLRDEAAVRAGAVDELDRPVDGRVVPQTVHTGTLLPSLLVRYEEV